MVQNDTKLKIIIDNNIENKKNIQILLILIHKRELNF